MGVTGQGKDGEGVGGSEGERRAGKEREGRAGKEREGEGEGINRKQRPEIDN